MEKQVVRPLIKVVCFYCLVSITASFPALELFHVQILESI